MNCRNKEAHCWRTDANPRFYKTGSVGIGGTGITNKVVVFEQGDVLFTGSTFTTIHSIPDTFSLLLAGQSWSFPEVFGVGGTTFGVGYLPGQRPSLADMTWDSELCGWFGSMIHPGGDFQPELTVELYVRQDGNRRHLYGKIWGESWTSDQWLRINATESNDGLHTYTWQIQSRGAEFSPGFSGVSWPYPPNATCEGWWDDVADMPTWMRTRPAKWTIHLPSIGDGLTIPCTTGLVNPPYPTITGPIARGEADYELRPLLLGTSIASAEATGYASYCPGSGFNAPGTYFCEEFYPANPSTCEVFSRNNGVSGMSLEESTSGLVSLYTFIPVPGITGQGQIQWYYPQGGNWNPWGESTLYPALDYTLYPPSAGIVAPVTLSPSEWGTGGPINAGGW